MKKVSIIIVILFFAFVISKEVLASVGLIYNELAQSICIDDIGNIYIGHRDTIEVINNGKMIKNINPQTNRSYVFTIADNQLIIGYASGKSKVFDLSGNYLNDGTQRYEEIKRLSEKTRVFTNEQGVFKVKKYFGLEPYEIVKNDECIYKQSSLDYIYNGLPFTLFFVVAFINLFFLVCTVITNDKYREMFR